MAPFWIQLDLLEDETNMYEVMNASYSIYFIIRELRCILFKFSTDFDISVRFERWR